MDEVGNDLDALVDYLQCEQEKHRDQLVRLPARRAVPLSATAGKQT